MPVGQTITISEELRADIKAFYPEIIDRLENPIFEQKRQLIDMLDVRGKLAIENEEKVVYVKCILGQQLLSVARTSPLSTTGNRQQPIVIRARLVFDRFVLRTV